MDVLVWNEIRCDLGVIVEWQEAEFGYLVRENDGTEYLVDVHPQDMFG